MAFRGALTINDKGDMALTNMDTNTSDTTQSWSRTAQGVPFDQDKLDRLLEQAGVDAILASSNHNVRYLSGGYLFFMYATADSIGLSRYLPLLGYVRGRPEDAFYVGAGNEDWGTEVEDVWVSDVNNVAWSTTEAAATAASAIRSRCGQRPTIGIEDAYMPHDAMQALARELPEATFVEATRVLEELRAVKMPEELDLMRSASEDVVSSMLATYAGSGESESKIEIAERFRREQTRRGLHFAYCLISMGNDLNRAPSGQQWRPGEVLSMDSGAERDGYFGDLVRMSVLGDPTSRMEELLSEVEAVQQAARAPIRAGTVGAEIYEHALAELEGCPDRDNMSFLAHGTGMVTHEAPRLTDKGSPPYPADHADRPLEAGMVISVETHVVDPEIGFVKLEDTIFVMPEGWEAAADFGRGWNVAGR